MRIGIVIGLLSCFVNVGWYDDGDFVILNVVLCVIVEGKSVMWDV